MRASMKAMSRMASCRFPLRSQGPYRRTLKPHSTDPFRRVLEPMFQSPTADTTVGPIRGYLDGLVKLLPQFPSRPKRERSAPEFRVALSRNLGFETIDSSRPEETGWPLQDRQGPS